MNRIGIIGAGRFGVALIESLADHEAELLLMDRNRDNVQRLSPLVSKAVQGDASDERAIKEAGFPECDTVVVAVGSDMEGSILATVNCKEVGVNRVIAKAVSDAHGKVLERVGADIVVYPNRDRAIRLARSLLSSSPIDLFEIADGFSVGEIAAPDENIGMSLMDAKVRQSLGVTVLAIRRKSEDTRKPRHTIIATGNDIIEKDDLWIVFGPDSQLAQMGMQI